MTVTDYALNLAANEITNRTIQVRLHTGDPGANGTANGITGATVDVAAGEWTAASGGDSMNDNDIDFGVLSTSQSYTVRWVSCFDGANFMGRSELSSAVTVGANESFSITADTLIWQGTST